MNWIEAAAIECRVAAQKCYVDGDAEYEDLDNILTEIIRRHAMQEHKAMDERKKIKVRIAVGVLPDGTWHANGGTCYSEEDAISILLECLDCAFDPPIFFVETELPFVERPAIQGTVVEENR